MPRIRSESKRNGGYYLNEYMMKRYYNDPEYRKKHNDYMKSRVTCSC